MMTDPERRGQVAAAGDSFGKLRTTAGSGVATVLHNAPCGYFV
jgi:hypothetical protein